nr:CPBP family intramembrane glutamic endopeptidase [Flavobacterium sp. Sd200]
MVFGIIGVILFITFATQYFQNTAKPYPDAETLLFQFTMPGIAEELVFRGVLLGLLNKVYTAKINIFGVPLGWAALITSVLFGVVHAFNFYSNSIDFNLGYFFSSFLMGLIFVFIKEKSQSLVPSIICHNLYNAVIVFF